MKFYLVGALGLVLTSTGFAQSSSEVLKEYGSAISENDMARQKELINLDPVTCVVPASLSAQISVMRKNIDTLEKNGKLTHCSAAPVAVPEKNRRLLGDSATKVTELASGGTCNGNLDMTGVRSSQVIPQKNAIINWLWTSVDPKTCQQLPQPTGSNYGEYNKKLKQLNEAKKKCSFPLPDWCPELRSYAKFQESQNTIRAAEKVAQASANNGEKMNRTYGKLKSLYDQAMASLPVYTEPLPSPAKGENPSTTKYIRASYKDVPMYISLYGGLGRNDNPINQHSDLWESFGPRSLTIAAMKGFPAGIIGIDGKMSQMMDGVSEDYANRFASGPSTILGIPQKEGNFNLATILKARDTEVFVGHVPKSVLPAPKHTVLSTSFSDSWRVYYGTDYFPNLRVKLGDPDFNKEIGTDSMPRTINAVSHGTTSSMNSVKSGKYYFEVIVMNEGAITAGFRPKAELTKVHYFNPPAAYGLNGSQKFKAGDVLGFSIDLDNRVCLGHLNGNWKTKHGNDTWGFDPNAKSALEALEEKNTATRVAGGNVTYTDPGASKILEHINNPNCPSCREMGKCFQDIPMGSEFVVSIGGLMADAIVNFGDQPWLIGPPTSEYKGIPYNKEEAKEWFRSEAKKSVPRFDYKTALPFWYHLGE